MDTRSAADMRLQVDSVLKGLGWEPDSNVLSASLWQQRYRYVSNQLGYIIEIMPQKNRDNLRIHMRKIDELFALAKTNIPASTWPIHQYKFVTVSFPSGLQAFLKRASRIVDHAKKSDLAGTYQFRTQAAPTERTANITQRIGQSLFRSLLLREWTGRCAVTGLTVTRLLRASHIIGWSEPQCSDRMRLDRHNGLLLAPHIDAAFDRHLVTFSDDGTIMIARSCVHPFAETLGIEQGMGISTPHMTKKRRRYLQHHRRRFLSQEQQLSKIPDD